MDRRLQESERNYRLGDLTFDIYLSGDTKMKGFARIEHMRACLKLRLKKSRQRGSSIPSLYLYEDSAHKFSYDSRSFSIKRGKVSSW